MPSPSPGSRGQAGSPTFFSVDLAAATHRLLMFLRSAPAMEEAWGHGPCRELYATREKKDIYTPWEQYLADEAEKKAMSEKLDRL